MLMIDFTQTQQHNRTLQRQPNNFLWLLRQFVHVCVRLGVNTIVAQGDGVTQLLAALP